MRGDDDMDYEQFYQNNQEFRRYVDQYCISYGYTVQEALNHALVQEVARYYEGISGAASWKCETRADAWKNYTGDLGNGILV